MAEHSLKFSVVVTGGDAVFQALTFKGKLEDGIKMASELGYDAVELALRDPSSLDLENLQGLLKKYSLQVSAIGTGRAYTEEGLSLSSPDEEVYRRAVERIKAHLRLADALGAKVIIGLMRGQPSQEELGSARKRFGRAMVELDALAGELGVELLLEPISPDETTLINSFDEAAEFLKEFSLKNTKLLYDTYHVYRVERDMLRTLISYFGLIGYIHVADSNRDVPGSAEIDFKALLGKLIELGYRGYVSLECASKLPPYEAARRNIEFLKGLISRF